jgi:hypothetical protein
MNVRLLTRLEAADPTFLPPALRLHGFPFLDPEWCWVVEYEGRAIALTVCSFAHGMLIFWRILSTPEAMCVCRSWFYRALPIVLDNARQRGCVGYLTMLEDHHPACVKIARIVARTGGVLVPFIGTLGAALIKP